MDYIRTSWHLNLQLSVHSDMIAMVWQDLPSEVLMGKWTKLSASKRFSVLHFNMTHGLHVLVLALIQKNKYSTNITVYMHASLLQSCSMLFSWFVYNIQSWLQAGPCVANCCKEPKWVRYNKHAVYMSVLCTWNNIGKSQIIYWENVKFWIKSSSAYQNGLWCLHELYQIPNIVTSGRY